MDRQKIFWHLSVEKEETLIKRNQGEAGEKKLALGHVLHSFLSFMPQDAYLSREEDLLLSQLSRYHIWQREITS